MSGVTFHCCIVGAAVYFSVDMEALISSLYSDDIFERIETYLKD